MLIPVCHYQPQVSRAGKSSGIAPWLLLAVVIAAVIVMRAVRPPAASGDLVGQPFPPLTVEGWIDNDSVNEAKLRGEVVLVDCWASWCGPCVANMPTLVKFYEKFHDQGLVVIGLTPETGGELMGLRAFVRSVDGLDWPIGYGAEVPIDMLGVQAFPTMILFDKSGKSVWAGHSFSGLEDAVITSLADKS